MQAIKLHLPLFSKRNAASGGHMTVHIFQRSSMNDLPSHGRVRKGYVRTAFCLSGSVLNLGSA